MRQLTQLLNAVLNSHSFIKIACGCVVITILTLVLFGPELVKILFANSREVANSASGQIDPQTVSAPQSTSYSTANQRGNSSVSDSSVPATPSLDEQVRKLNSETLLAKIGQLSRDVSQLRADLSGWNNRTADLATNDSGRRIANSPDCFLQVVSLIKSEPVTIEGVVELEDRLRLLGDNALNIRAANDKNMFQSHFSDAKERFDYMRGEVNKAVLALDLYEKRCRFVTASRLTLSEAVNQQEENDAIALADELARNQLAHDKQIANLKLEEQARQNQKALEREQDRVVAEEKRAAVEAQIEKDERAADLVKRQLLAEFERDLPQIKHYLAPLFVPGLKQPKIDRSLSLSDTPQPMSLAAIKVWCLLSDDTDDLHRDFGGFLELMTVLAKDRKISSPYPDAFGGALEEKRNAAIRPGYALLKKYQYLLVEKGYLRE